MPIRRCAFALGAFFAVAIPALASAADSGAEAAPPASAPKSVWSGLAGWSEEIEAEDLELRDELVAAEMSYLAALDKAIAEASGLPDEDPRREVVWARIEYLVETAFRLLDQTGEYERFLKGTLPLAPERGNPLTAIRFEDGALERDPGGGLLFGDAESGREALGDPPPGASARPVGESPRRAFELAMIKSRAAWLRARAFLRTGREKSATEEASGLGVIRDWLLLGPLDADMEVDSPAPDGGPGGELRTLSADASYPGKNGPVSWRAFASVDPLGRLYPEAVFGLDGDSTAYALALVRSPDDRPAALRFGSNGPATIRVNHGQVQDLLPDGLASPDQDAFDIRLRKGWNSIMVKTSSGGDGWRMVLRLTDPDGRPFPGKVAKAEAEDVPRILAEARRAADYSLLDRTHRPACLASLGGMTLLARHLIENPDDARAYFYLGSLLAAKRLMEGGGRFDRDELFRSAIELSGGDPFFLLMAARAAEMGVEGPDREENLRLALLRLAAGKGSAAALVDMGRLYLDVMRQPRRAGSYAARALAANPMSHRAGILEYDVARTRGWRPLANEHLERLRTRHPDAAPVRLRSGRAAMERGRYRQALSEFHALLEIDAGNREALSGAADALIRLGQTSAAVDILARQLRRFPYDSSSRMKLAELYRGLGRTEEALEAISEELRIRPESPEALAMRREMLRERQNPASDQAPRGAVRAPLPEGGWQPLVEPPSEGWEFLYFQLEDKLRKNGVLDRNIAFAARIYTAAAASKVRHLGFALDSQFESGTILDITIVNPDGTRDKLSPPAGKDGADAVRFFLPPLLPGTVVEAELRIQRRRILFLGDYFGQIASLSHQVPVRFHRYIFIHPGDRRFFFRSMNGAPEALVLPDDDSEFITRVWEMENVPGFSREPSAPSQNQATPSVQMSSFANWDEFARWYWRLIGSQYRTPPELLLLAERAGGAEPFPMARLDRAAEWIAGNLGVRDLEFGVYAFRPIGVRAILSRRSADAKDRTLLLCLLAGAFGLRAWPVLAQPVDPESGHSGEGGLELPLLDHFSHSLAAVESGAGGDILLDASSPNRPPGVVPTTLFGASALRIAPDSAEPLVIPDSGVLGCEWSEESEITVDENGSVLWEQKVRGAGLAAEALRARFKNEATRENAWAELLAGMGAAVSAAACDFTDGEPSPAHALFFGRARIRGLAKTGGKRVTLRIPPLPGRTGSDADGDEFPLSLKMLAARGERSQPLLLPGVFRIVRRIGVSYPPEWRLENPPAASKTVLPFGTISLAVSESPGQLQCEFVFEVSRRTIQPREYSAFRKAAVGAGRWRRPFISLEQP
ncbi:MAG: DUF3857 domain-containing protein [Planctomycetota bacterium]|jgi:tetratricopeptide (TPR) repeat protein|nr:DUF3857 domain-containing protein [Planctomycetota bacterium]